MEVKIYSVADCRQCDVLREVLQNYQIEYTEIKVLSILNEDEEGISYQDYLQLEPDIPLIERCSFPQVYIDGKRIGNITQTANFLQNENK